MIMKLRKWHNCKTKTSKGLSFFEVFDSHQSLQLEFSWSFLCNNSSLGLKSMLYTHCGFCNNGWIPFEHSTVTRFSKYSKYFLMKNRFVSWTSGWCKKSSTWKKESNVQKNVSTQQDQSHRYTADEWNSAIMVYSHRRSRIYYVYRPSTEEVAWHYISFKISSHTHPCCDHFHVHTSGYLYHEHT